MPFERKFSADKMLLNEFSLKSFRFLVIASDLQMSLIKRLYFLKKKLKLLKDFLTKYVDAPGTSQNSFIFGIKYPFSGVRNCVKKSTQHLIV